MLSLSARLSILLFGLVVLVTATARRAWAGTFDVYPVRVELSKKRNQSALLTVTNRGKAPLRLQASAFAWSQSEAGEVELSETTDIIFFPSMLTIAPGQSRKIRVGTSANPEEKEQTYRLIVEELPDPNQPALANGIRILTRMSIPVFVQADGARPIVTIEEVRADADELVVSVGNPGNKRFVLRHVSIEARDTSGKLVFTEKLPGWYLLASGRRVFRIKMPELACEQMAKVAVEARGQSDSEYTKLELPGFRCEE